MWSVVCHTHTTFVVATWVTCLGPKLCAGGNQEACPVGGGGRCAPEYSSRGGSCTQTHVFDASVEQCERV
jgi:hypothetical protein